MSLEIQSLLYSELTGVSINEGRDINFELLGAINYNSLNEDLGIVRYSSGTVHSKNFDTGKYIISARASKYMGSGFGFRFRYSGGSTSSWSNRELVNDRPETPIIGYDYRLENSSYSGTAQSIGFGLLESVSKEFDISNLDENKRRIFLLGEVNMHNNDTFLARIVCKNGIHEIGLNQSNLVPSDLGSFEKLVIDLYVDNNINSDAGSSISNIFLRGTN